MNIIYLIYSNIVLLVIVLLTIKCTSAYHKHRRYIDEEFRRIDDEISYLQTRNASMRADIYRRIDKIQQELIRENASILKTVKTVKPR
jgi:hypothetical protein